MPDLFRTNAVTWERRSTDRLSNVPLSRSRCYHWPSLRNLIISSIRAAVMDKRRTGMAELRRAPWATRDSLLYCEGRLILQIWKSLMLPVQVCSCSFFCRPMLCSTEHLESYSFITCRFIDGG